MGLITSSGSQESVSEIQEDQILKSAVSIPPPTIILEDILAHLDTLEKFNEDNVERRILLAEIESLAIENAKLKEQMDELIASHIEVRNDLVEMKADMAHRAQTVDDIVKNLNTAELRLEVLEQNQNNTRTDHERRLADLEAEIQAVRDGIPYNFNTSRGFSEYHERLLELEAQHLCKEVIIFGLPETGEENLKDLVSSMFSILQADISQDDVVLVQRMGREEENSQKPRAVRLCLKSELKANLLLQVVKTKSRLYANEISAALPMRKIIVKRRVPSALPLLRRKILEQWDQLRPKDVWLGRTVVFVRLRRDEEPIRIHYEGDFYLIS